MFLIPVSSERLSVTYEHYKTTELKVKEDAQILKTWIEKQSHLMRPDDEYAIECMLMRSKCSVSVAQQAMENYISLKLSMPEYFQNRDPLLPEFTTLLETIYLSPLPQPSVEGYRGFMFKINKDTSNVTAETILKYNCLIGLMVYSKDKNNGEFCIFDLEHAGLEYFLKWTLPTVRKMNTMSSRNKTKMKGFHFINAPQYINMVLTIVKSVVKRKIASRIHVHQNLESLYKHVDRRILPIEYGGEEKPLKELSAATKESLNALRDWFLEDDELTREIARKEEEKRTSSKDLKRLKKSLVKLEID